MATTTRRKEAGSDTDTLLSGVHILWIGLTACEHKDLCYDHPHFAKVRVVFDWTKISNHDKPEGMRSYFIRPMMKATRGYLISPEERMGKWSSPRMITG